ncbi:MAG TPA: thiamine-phosphate kinase [Armatimonadota bacterium]|jgi:thiamine-monophosphate kinase
MLVSEVGEFGLIERLRRLDVVRGVGDDCAVLRPPDGHELVITADALIEGVHFRHEWTTWRDLGWKSLAVNFSDVAAMGALPAGALLTLGLRADTRVSDVEQFYLGAASLIASASEDAAIVGGDIVASPLATAISVTAFGFVPTGQALRRSGARAGDEIWVSGTLGDSAAGLLLRQADRVGAYLKARHDAPEPRVWQGRAVRRAGAVSAMIDISDGLAGDLGHILEESRVGAVIESGAIPLSGELRAACTDNGWDPLDLALHGGEDYELLMTVNPDRAAEAKNAAQGARGGVPLTRIGRIVNGTGVIMISEDGSSAPIAPRAFRHF